MIIWICTAVLLASWALTWLLRRYALARSLMDVPNARSSHSIPTPRGGGVAIVIGFLVAAPLLVLSGLAEGKAMFAYLGGGAAVAFIGFADDHGHIAPRWRLLGHFLAAGWTLFWLGGLAPLALPWGIVDLGWVGVILALVYLVWMLNLYNFMDGIDGLASAEAICVCAGACALYALTGHAQLFGFPLVLCAAVAGFLIWNFPPARIFMGDAGSGFLGLIIGAFALEGAKQDSHLLWSWLILLGVFVLDATWTLLHRLLRGEKVYEAHRSHGYQFAARHYGSHRTVTLGVVVINLCWLLPIALWVASQPSMALVGVVLAYAPLCVLAYRFGAGSAERR
ncbi:MraY family glycosyltransferase [Pseudomonas sp. TE3610]